MMPEAPLDRWLPRLSTDAARWARFAAVLAAAALLLWAALGLSVVLTPIVAGLAIAYVLNPVVTVLDRRFGVRRLTSVTVGLLAVIGLAAALLLAVAVQLVQFAASIPEYIARLQQWAQESFPALFEDEQAATFTELLRAHGATAGRTVMDFVGGAFSNAAYWLSLVVLLPMYTFVFLLRFDHIVRVVHDHLPAASRETIVHIVTTIDRAVADFFRGRLIVCLIVGTLSAVGWMLVSVPYAFPLGALAGALNLVPFASVLALVPAMILAYMQAVGTETSWVWALCGVFAVYAVVQAIESFALSPLIESRSSGLHPVTTVVALLIGAQVAGLLGMLLAIPITSTLKSLSVIYLLPEIRRLADMEKNAE